MKKFIFIFLCLLILTGCNTKNKISYEITLNKYNANYEWIYTVADDSILKIIKDDNEFKIISLIPGNATIYFDYVNKEDSEDVLYNYQIDLEVDKTLSVNKVFESGSYVSLQRLLNLGKDKIGLKEDLNNYNFMFNDNVVNVNDDECDWLVAYDKNGEIVESYAISRANDNIYRNMGEKRVLIN